jgi:hypothetical protein
MTKGQNDPADQPGYLYLRNRGYSHAKTLHLLELSRNHPNAEELHARGLDGIVFSKESGMDRL